QPGAQAEGARLPHRGGRRIPSLAAGPGRRDGPPALARATPPPDEVGRAARVDGRPPSLDGAATTHGASLRPAAQPAGAKLIVQSSLDWPGLLSRPLGPAKPAACTQAVSSTSRNGG